MLLKRIYKNLHKQHKLKYDAKETVTSVSKDNSDKTSDKKSDIIDDTKEGNIYKASKSFNYIFADDYELDEKLRFSLPRWSYADFIQERRDYVKQVDSLLGEHAWCYFKIFFRFDNNIGLFGNILGHNAGARYELLVKALSLQSKNNLEQSSSNDGETINADKLASDSLANPNVKTTIQLMYTKYIDYSSSAIGYLHSNHIMYKHEKLGDRAKALVRFTKLLSFISCKAPWFFLSINGLDKANNVYDEEKTKDNSIEIQCDADAIDMRLLTLLNLYKYACYDDINFKEILPLNLRKFDMDIIVFLAPLKYYQTGMSSKTRGTFDYKHLLQNGASSDRGKRFSNMMSFLMFSFHNCEIDKSCIGGVMPSGITNDKGFTLGKNIIKINYDRCYFHEMNEWNLFLFGSDGFYYDSKAFSDPLLKVFDYDYDSYTSNILNDLVVSGKPSANIQNKRILAIEDALNNIMYYNKYTSLYKELIDASESIITDAMRAIDPYTVLGNLYNGYELGSDYSNEKLDMIHGEGDLGSVYNYDFSPGTDYFDRKLKNLNLNLGNIFNYLLGRTGDSSHRSNTPYLSSKLKNLKSNSGTTDDYLKEIELHGISDPLTVVSHTYNLNGARDHTAVLSSKTGEYISKNTGNWFTRNYNKLKNMDFKEELNYKTESFLKNALRL